LLEEWNFIDDANLPQPLIFDEWFSQIEAIIYDELSEEIMKIFGGRAQTTDELLRLGNESIWLNEHGGLEKVLQDSFTATIEHLETTYGKDQAKWKWGDFHQVLFKHPLASANKMLGYFFNAKKPLPVNGSAVTALAARQTEEGIVNHGASWRFVIDLDDISTGHHTVSPGQSGHFRSPWYSDQAEDWVNGTFHETNIEKVEGKVLKLLPE